MLRAIHEVRNTGIHSRGGIALWYPSPSEYDALSFLASLSDALANEIERSFRRSPVLRLLTSVRLAIGAGLGVALAGFLVFTNGLMDLSSGVPVQDIADALVIGLGTFFLFRIAGTILNALSPGADLLRESARMRARARFSSTLREGAEFGAEGGQWLLGRWKRTREQELVERPSTLSSLVNDFRALAEHAGRYVGRVLIAIDELDKMDDPKLVKELLRDVKGVFDIPNVHFLVSVSDEAARSLNLGALTGRSEFNSSFYTVIELPPVSTAGCADLLEQRSGMEASIARVIGVLAGGNPREVLRLAETVDANQEAADVVVRVLRDEALNLRREIVTAPSLEGRPSVGDEARIQAFRALPDRSFADPPAFLDHHDDPLQQSMWEPAWAQTDAPWKATFGEPWRRLLVRLAVGGRLIRDAPNILHDEDRLLQLRDVVTAASEGAAVARIVFEEEIRVDTRSAG